MKCIMNPHHSNIFAYRLKNARKAQKLSQEKLGILAGIDENSASARMNQYERGKHFPDFLMMNKIAQALNLPTAYFYAENDDLAEIIQTYSTLDNDMKLSVLQYMKQLTINSQNNDEKN